MLTMLPKKVAIEPLFDPDKIGSIYVPDQAKGRCDQGLVKYIGCEVETVEVGDHVLFSGYTGTLMQVEDEGLLIIMPEEFVTCIIYEELIEIPGLYARDKEGNYFNVTHEMALHVIANAMRGHTSMRSSFNARQRGPAVADYDRLR